MENGRSNFRPFFLGLRSGVSELRVWQRRHSKPIVAEVTPVSGMGTWEACAWPADDRHRAQQVGRQFSLLTDAQAAADTTARRMVPHDCNLDCGPWTAIERRRNPRT
jgi:hypothetical protein